MNFSKLFPDHCVVEIKSRPLVSHGHLKTVLIKPMAFARNSAWSPPQATKTYTATFSLLPLHLPHSFNISAMAHKTQPGLSLQQHKLQYKTSDKPASWFYTSNFYPKSSCYSFIKPQSQPNLKNKIKSSLSGWFQARLQSHLSAAMQTYRMQNRWEQSIQMAADWGAWKQQPEIYIYPANHVKHATAQTGQFKDFSMHRVAFHFPHSGLYLKNTCTDKQSPLIAIVIFRKPQHEKFSFR